MRSRFKVQVLALLVTLSLASSDGLAGTYVFDLPVAQQTLLHGDPALTVPFSSSIQFHSIESITIDLFGTQEDGLVHVLTRSRTPVPWTPLVPITESAPHVILANPLARGAMDGPYNPTVSELPIGWTVFADSWTVTERFMTPELLVGISGDDGWGIWKNGSYNDGAGLHTWRAGLSRDLHSVPRIGPNSFDEFKDGSADIMLQSLLSLWSNWDTGYSVISPSAFHLDGVRVTIVGQAVPEPASVVLVASILAAVCWVRGSMRS